VGNRLPEKRGTPFAGEPAGLHYFVCRAPQHRREIEKKERRRSEKIEHLAGFSAGELRGMKGGRRGEKKKKGGTPASRHVGNSGATCGKKRKRGEGRVLQHRLNHLIVAGMEGR